MIGNDPYYVTVEKNKTVKPVFPVVLHLTLHKKWFNLILSGEKTEEYRAISEHWSKVFHNGNIKIKGKYYHPTDVLIEFRNGYSKFSPQILIECKGLRVGFPKAEWSEEDTEQRYILSLGKIINTLHI